MFLVLPAGGRAGAGGRGRARAGGGSAGAILRFRRSSNVIAELTGSEFPDEVIVIGGHIDSWDVGQGAIDDAGGAFAAWEALKLLADLGLKPKRTIRAVMWNAEENSGAGAEPFLKSFLGL